MKTFIIIDPPEGWMYGFPKSITAEEFAKIRNTKQWCIDNGYPKNVADSYENSFHIGISYVTKESTSSLPITWWRNFDYNTQDYLKRKYNLVVFGSYTDGNVVAEITQIYNNEMYVATRVKAMKWWNGLTLEEKFYKVIPWLKDKKQSVDSRHPQSLTGREIEELYEKQSKSV